MLPIPRHAERRSRGVLAQLELKKRRSVAEGSQSCTGGSFGRTLACVGMNMVVIEFAL